MSAIQQAIKEAVESGYELPSRYEAYGGGGCGDDVHWGIYTVEDANVGTKVSYAVSVIFLDSLFWQALGKARAWDDHDDNPEGAAWSTAPSSWLRRWHRFIDYLASGKSAESFFETLV